MQTYADAIAELDKSRPALIKAAETSVLAAVVLARARKAERETVAIEEERTDRAEANARVHMLNQLNKIARELELPIEPYLDPLNHNVAHMGGLDFVIYRGVDDWRDTAALRRTCSQCEHVEVYPLWNARADDIAWALSQPLRHEDHDGSRKRHRRRWRGLWELLGIGPLIRRISYDWHSQSPQGGQ